MPWLPLSPCCCGRTPPPRLRPLNTRLNAPHALSSPPPQRLEIDYTDLLVGPGNSAVLEAGIAEVARKYGMEWKISYRERQARVALLVSKLDHCLYDLLIRRESGELQCQIPVVISNHPDLESVTRKFDIPFRYLPLDGCDPASKAAQEAAIEAILEEEGIDLIVLARYLQIFSPDFCQRHWHRTINVHHSFLPAFEGAQGLLLRGGG